MAGRFRRIVLLVVGGTFLTLVVGLRSVLVPLKAVLLNLLSVGAAFGALALVFQEGQGGRLFGVAEPLGAVFSSVPLVVFCIVFGLSMDYEVFLMTRVMEARRLGASDRDAIVEALGTTGPVITNAAATGGRHGGPDRDWAGAPATRGTVELVARRTDQGFGQTGP